MTGRLANLMSQTANTGRSVHPKTSIASSHAVHPLGEQAQDASDCEKPRTIAPAVSLALRERHGKEDECDGDSKDDQSDKIELLGEKPGALQIALLHWRGEVFARRGNLYETELDCLSLAPEESEDERGQGHRDEYGKHRVWVVH